MIFGDKNLDNKTFFINYRLMIQSLKSLEFEFLKIEDMNLNKDLSLKNYVGGLINKLINPFTQILK